MKRRHFVQQGLLLPLGTLSVAPFSSNANPVVWAFIRTVIWPAVEALGAVVVDGVAAAAADWFKDKAIEFAADRVIGKLHPESRMYRLATKGKKLYSVYGTVTGVMTVAEAIKLIVAGYSSKGDPVVIWGGGEGTRRESSRLITPYCAMRGIHLKILADIREEFLADVRSARQIDPDRAATDQELIDALLIPTTDVSEDELGGKGVLFSFKAGVANLRVLLSEVKTTSDSISMRYDVSIRTGADPASGVPDQLIWKAKARGCSIPLGVS